MSTHASTASPRASVQGRRPLLKVVAAAAALTALSGCMTVPTQTMAPDESPVVLGPAVRHNVTPMEAVLACMGDQVATAGRAPLVISVGDVKDYTGKYNINEGNAITQGGALMVYSALGKLGGAVQVAERFDPVIAEREMAYADRRQLGDGRAHQLPGPNGGQTVPWVPYFGGTIKQSDYFIVGGITELNYNISSGGGQVAVSQVGFKARRFSQSVGVDLRVVDTRTLMIVKTVSLTKQFHGYEVGFNLFRFFDNQLFDIDIGAKGQEPVQLGIRAALEEGVARLVAAVSQVDPQPCLALRGAGELSRVPAEQLRRVANPKPAVGAVAAQQRSGIPVNAGSQTGTTVSGAVVQIPFEFGATVLTGGTLALLDQIATAAAQGSSDVVLVARDTEVWDASRRDALTDQRLAVVGAALASRGIAPGAITVTWRPDKSDSAMHRDGPGLQEIAKLRVGGNDARATPSPTPTVLPSRR